MIHEMGTHAQKQSSMQLAGGVLQRKCGKCHKNEKVLQRSATGLAPKTMSPIAHEVLRSPGLSLNAATLSFIEPRFGYNFSQVKVHTATPKQIQTESTVNQPEDKYELEANRVVEQMMRMPESDNLRHKNASSQHTIAGGEHAVCRKGRLNLHRRATNQNGPTTVPPIVHEVLSSPGQPLTSSTRQFMEPRFGHDFSQVRIHTDTKAAESAQAVNARAFTVAQHVVFGTGQYAPHTAVGQRLLAHELTHVVQQRGTFSSWVSRSPTTQLQRQTDDEARRIRFRCGPEGMGCDLTTTCRGKPCALSDCGKGRCPTWVCKGLENLAIRNWCAYRCVPSGSAFYLVSAIGGWKFLKTCLD